MANTQQKILLDQKNDKNHAILTILWLAQNESNLNKWLDGSVKLLRDKGIIFLIFPTEILDQVLIFLSKKTGSFKIFPFWPNQKKSSKRIILYAVKGGSSPSELMPGLKLYNNNGVITKKAKLLSEEGIFHFL